MPARRRQTIRAAQSRTAVQTHQTRRFTDKTAIFDNQNCFSD
jgi:hypothetical protein